MARSVGEVYVTVIANTKVFEQQVKSAARDAADGAGAEIDSRLSRSFRDAASKWVKDQDLRRVTAETGRQIARTFGLSFEDGLNDVSLTKQFSAVLQEFADATGNAFDDVFESSLQVLLREYEREMVRVQTEAEAANRRFNANRERERAAALRAEERLEREVTEAVSTRSVFYQSQLASMQAANVLNRVQLDMERARLSTLTALTKEQDRLADIIEKQQKEYASKAFLPLQRFGDALRSTGRGTPLRFFTRLLAFLPDIALLFDRIATSLTNKILGGLEKMFQSITSFGEKRAIGALQAFGAALGAVTAASGPYIQAAITITAVLGTLATGFSLLGAAVAAVSAAVGVLTALGSALSYAAGSIAAFLPLAAGLGAAAGVIALGIKGVPDAIKGFAQAISETDPEKQTKALERYAEALGELQPSAASAVKALEPVVRKFSELRDVIQERLFAGLDEEVRALQGLFDEVGAGLERFAGSVNQAFKNALAPLKDSAFLDDLRRNFAGLGPIVEDFGAGLGNFLAGLNGLIEALLPAGEKLSGWFKDITETFKDWTQSATGKNTIRDFMEKAWESASKVKDIIQTIGEAIGIAFGASYGTGQTFLDSVLEKAEQFRKWLEDRVNDGSFQEWLDSASQIASDLWKALEKVVEAFGKMDNPTTRQFLSDIITLVGDLLGYLGDISAFIDSPSWQGLGEVLLTPFLLFLDGLAHLSGTGIPVLDAMGSAARAAADGIRGMLNPDTTGAFDWAAIGLDALTSLREQGILTNEELDFIVNERDLPVFPTELANKLMSLKNQGLLTDEQLAAIVGDKTLSTWPEVQQQMLADVGFQALLTDGTLSQVVAGRPIPPWLQTMIGQLVSAGTQASITQGRIAAIPGDKQVRIGITETGYEVVYGKIKTILDQNGKTVNITIKGTSAGTGPGGPLDPNAATGRLVTSPQRILVGEAGTEAIIPLARPLGQIDPSVRGLAALIRGDSRYRRTSDGSTPGKTVNVAMSVYPTQADPELVAAAVLNRAVTLARA